MPAPVRVCRALYAARTPGRWPLMRRTPALVITPRHDRGPAADAGAGLRAGCDGAGLESGVHLQLREVHRVARRCAAGRRSLSSCACSATPPSATRSSERSRAACSPATRMTVSHVAPVEAAASVPRPVCVGRDGRSSGAAGRGTARRAGADDQRHRRIHRSWAASRSSSSSTASCASASTSSPRSAPGSRSARRLLALARRNDESGTVTRRGDRTRSRSSAARARSAGRRCWRCRPPRRPNRRFPISASRI